MSESAWKWGPYKRGMGVEGDDPRIIHAVVAIKAELVFHGFALKLDSTRFGPKTYRAVQSFQGGLGLVVDGQVGPRTANALWSERIAGEAIPGDWLRAQIHWESGDDPGAQFTNPDGSRDRGLVQLNSGSGSLSEEEVWDPSVTIGFLAGFLRRRAREFADCPGDRWRLAVGSWRTPVGAREWCEAPNLVPDADGTWGQKAAYYVGRVDTDGRKNWAGSS